MIQIFLEIEGVLFVITCRVPVIRVLRQVIFIRQKRPYAAQLQDALTAVHYLQLIDR